MFSRLVTVVALVAATTSPGKAQTQAEIVISSGYEYGMIQVSQSPDKDLHYQAYDPDHKALRVDVDTETPSWTVKLPRPAEVAERTSAVLAVAVPRSVGRVRVLNTRGRVQVTNLASDVEVQSASGRVSIKGTGAVRLSAASGEAEIQDVGGDVNLDTKSANVRVANVTGDFSFSLGSGNLNVAEVKGTVQGKASTGNIDLSGPSGPVRIRSINGNTRVLCPKGAVEIRDSSGVSEVVRPVAGVDVETSTGRTTIFSSSVQSQLIKAKTLSGAATVVLADTADFELTLDSFQKHIDLDPVLRRLRRESQDGRHVSVSQGERKLRIFMESFGGRLAVERQPLPPCTAGSGGEL